jgi:hypothetical protein
MKDDALHSKDSTSHFPIFILVVVLKGLLDSSEFAFFGLCPWLVGLHTIVVSLETGVSFWLHGLMQCYPLANFPPYFIIP